MAGAIRNQLNQVTRTVDSGTFGDSFMSDEEKALREAMKTVAQKEAKDWTLDEQKAAATDIAKNGTSSVVYAKAKAAMDAGTEWAVKLTDGRTMQYSIIGINHDDLADGSGKAGLTFMTTGAGGYVGLTTSARMNATDTNVGGWVKSELRQKMNGGDIWNMLPADLQSKVKSVRKLTNNIGGLDKNAAVTATTDKLFLLSRSEITKNPNSIWPSWSGYSWLGAEGVQYEGRACVNLHPKALTRSAVPGSSTRFIDNYDKQVSSAGPTEPTANASRTMIVYAAFCF